MIPSRPLDLAGIIGEAIRLIKKTYWRTALVSLMCFLPALIVMWFGIDNLLDSSETVVKKCLVKKCLQSAPEAPSLVRDYLFLMKKSTTPQEIIYRFQYPGLFTVIDSVSADIRLRYPDDSSRAELKAKFDSVGSVISGALKAQSGETLLDAFLPGLILCAIGFISYMLAAIAQSAALYDLECRAFENRPFHLGAVFRLALSRNMWLLIVQFFLIVLAMALGLGVVVGITAAISTVLGVLGLFASFVVIAYALFRIMFASIALVSENLGPIASVKRSFALTTGQFWRVVGICMLGVLMIFIIRTIIMTPVQQIMYSSFTGVAANFIRGNPPDVLGLIHQVRSSMMSYLGWIAIIPSLLLSSLYPAFFTTFYYDLRTRLDGPLDYYDRDEPNPTHPPVAPEELSALPSEPTETNQAE
jgi:hypothetical protein